jgi:hypothetical protein
MANGGSLLDSGSPTEDEVIGKNERVDRWASRTKRDAQDLSPVELAANGWKAH